MGRHRIGTGYLSWSILLGMTHRAEVRLLESDRVGAALGEFETAVEARSACAEHERGGLSWLQPWEGLWEAQGIGQWYRVISSR